MDTIAMFDSDSDSDDGFDLRRERRLLRYNCEDIFKLSDKNFQQSFRMNKEAFKYILSEMVSRGVDSQRQGALSAKWKLAACLRFFAEGNYQLGVGKDFTINIAQPTFSKVLSDVLEALEGTLCSKWISLSMNTEEELSAKSAFYEKSGIPNIIMAVDGTHVKINGPRRDKHLFFNRKGFYSINVMIICDHNHKIRYVSAQYPGSCDDSHVWDMNSAKNFLESKFRRTRTQILGDKGYPLQPWLLTPFKEPINCERKRRFNAAHSKGSIVVKKTIGILKSVFRCLSTEKGLHYDPKKAAKIINLCCAFHNIRLHYNVASDDLINKTSQAEETDDNYYDETTFTENEAAVEIRNQILESF